MSKMDQDEAFFNNITYYTSAIEKIIMNNIDVFKPHKPTVESDITKDTRVIQHLPHIYSNEKQTEIQPTTFKLQEREEKTLVIAIQYDNQFDFDKPFLHPHDKRNIKYEDEEGHDANIDSIVDSSLIAPEKDNLEETHKPKRIEIEPSILALQHNEEKTLVRAIQYSKQFDFNKSLIDPHDKRNIKYEDEEGYDANRDSIVDFSPIAPEIDNLEETHKPKHIEIEPSILELQHNEEKAFVRAKQYGKQFDFDKSLIDPHDKRNIKYEDEDCYDANRDSVMDDIAFISPGIVQLEEADKPFKFHKHSENEPRYHVAFKNPNAINLQPTEQLENKSDNIANSSSRCFCNNDDFPDATVQQSLLDSRKSLRESQKLHQMDHQIHQVSVIQNTDSLQVRCDTQRAKATIENETVQFFFKIDKFKVHQPDVMYREGSSEIERENQSTRLPLEKEIARDVVTLILPKKQLDTDEVQDVSHPETIQKNEIEIPLSKLLKRVRARNQAEYCRHFRKSLQTDFDTEVDSVGKCGEPNSQSRCPPPVKTRDPPCPPMCPPPCPPAPVSYPPQPCKPLCPSPGAPGQCPPKPPLPPDKKDPCCPKFDFSKYFPTQMVNGVVSLVQIRNALGKLNLAQNNFLTTKDRFRKLLLGDCSADIHCPRLLPVKIMSAFDSSFANCENVVNNLLPRGCKTNDPWAPSLWWPGLKKQANKPFTSLKEGCLYSYLGFPNL